MLHINPNDLTSPYPSAKLTVLNKIEVESHVCLVDLVEIHNSDPNFKTSPHNEMSWKTVNLS